jgi:hypothetical protein
VDGKDDDFSHRANRTTAAGARKTARGVRVASHYQFATHRLDKFVFKEPDEEQTVNRPLNTFR